MTQVALAQDEDMVETLSPDRADEAFREGSLPRTLGSREDFLDLHALHALAEGVPVDGVAIAEEIGWSGVGREGVHGLLSGPSRGGMLGDVEVEDPAPMVSEDDQDEEHPQLSSGHSEEVDRDEIPDVIREERPPGLRGRCRALRDQAGDRTLGYFNPELQQLPMDSGCAPERIRGGHLADEGDDLMISALIDGRPTWRLLESLAQ